MTTITKEDAANLLKLIDRALKHSPQSGGLRDHLATHALINKLVAITKEADGQQDGNPASQ